MEREEDKFEQCHQTSAKRRYSQAFGQPSPVQNPTEQRVAECDRSNARLKSPKEDDPISSGENELSRVAALFVPEETQHTHCFGTLDNVAIRLRNGSPIPRSDLGEPVLNSDGTPYQILQISWAHGHGQIYSVAPSHIAMLNSQTSAQLLGISCFELLRAEGVIPSAMLDPMYSSQGSLEPGIILYISINLYGESVIADTVARGLSRNDLYLQDPIIIPGDIDYINPQVLRIPEDVLELAERRDYIQNKMRDNYAGGISQEEKSCDASEILQQALNDGGLALNTLLNQFSHHYNLSEALTDHRVRTVLMSYQKQALDFVLRRESNMPGDLPSLWTIVDDQDNNISFHDHRQAIYRHKITGAQSTETEDIHGGILADDMGLGKSLVMLSAILKTSALARDYALAITRPPGPEQKAIIAARSTIIVVPSVLLIETWIQEILKHISPYTASYYVYHGQHRKTSLTKLLDHDIILTTYGTLTVEYKSKESVLLNTRWYRIILDEAHVIRNAATVQFRAVSSISSNIRWCLSGTPIQNSLDDLGSLVSFLQLPLLKEGVQFRRYVARKTAIGSKECLENLRNLQILLGSICLRRLQTVLPFDRPHETVHQVDLTVTERNGYKLLERAWDDAIRVAVDGHKSKHVHRSILEALLRLRLYCNHTVALPKPTLDNHKEVDEIGSILQQSGDAVCRYCSCDVSAFGGMADGHCGIITICERVICVDCKDRYIQELEKLAQCPICHQAHTVFSDSYKETTISMPLLNQEIPSKIQRLCQDLEDHRHMSKSVVFSMWQKSLDIVCRALNRTEILYIRVDGSMIPSQRKKALQEFEAADTGVVLLMTFGTGAVGLNNLLVANRVHILEPQWNPFVENQAIGRVARLGQTQTVHVIRYIVNKTIEEGMVQDGQLRKLRLATSGFGRGDKSQVLADLICST